MDYKTSGMKKLFVHILPKLEEHQFYAKLIKVCGIKLIMLDMIHIFASEAK